MNIYIPMSIPIFTAMSINMDINIMSIQPGMPTVKRTAMSTSMRRWSTCMSMHTRTRMSICTSIPTSILTQKTLMCMSMSIPESMAAMSMCIRRMRRRPMSILIERVKLAGFWGYVPELK
jgi:hypothetical protein